MFQAIVTKFHGPTNTRGSRISATADAGRVSVPYRHALSVEENHAAAAKALALKIGWDGAWVAGGMPGGRGNVYVLANHDAELVAPHFTPAFRVGGETA